MATVRLGLRYGWRDFVECVVYNGENLPAGPFEWMQPVGVADGKRDLVVPAPSPTPGKRLISWHMISLQNLTSHGRIKSPPMGFNSWNFYHCNIDENIVKDLHPPVTPRAWP